MKQYSDSPKKEGNYFGTLKTRQKGMDHQTSEHMQKQPEIAVTFGG